MTNGIDLRLCPQGPDKSKIYSVSSVIVENAIQQINSIIRNDKTNIVHAFNEIYS